ncbi:autotransporter domain-containing protein [Parasphingorhabdus sp.]|uniref:autotransporter domain-containing protein n=1 Tax=Parasphingorhabdus sp. TaxID=2709688 RepID=UPI003D2D6B2F
MISSPNGSARFTPTRFLAATSAIAILVSTQAQAQQVIGDGDNITVTSGADGETITSGIGVVSIVDGAPIVIIDNDDVTLDNAGTLRTNSLTQTVQVNQGTTGAIINNAATGRLEADSRVVNFDGTDATLNNDGVILGTGSQRNGAVYANRTSNNITINNNVSGTIDAGAEGAGIAIEVGGGGAPRGGSITNAGLVQGRGQAAPAGGTAGDGLRFFGPGLAPEYIYAGNITNSGTFTSESAVGPTAAIRFANRIGFQGTLTNEATGVVSGVNNGLYFGNDADHTGGLVNNAGTISSDSRALNIDGTGLVVNNLAGGQIIGTGNQRNGTVYADSTAQNFTLNNDGLIDAGAGNEGAGFSVELSADGNDFEINNSGTIQGRGNVAAGLTTAGDGIRLERGRVAGALDGTTTGLFTGTITNSGLIDSEGANGTVAGIRVVNGVSFQGMLNNEEGGVISGLQNGLYFGNPTPAGGGDHRGGVVNNAGTISSGSRALNIDGTGLVINNLTTGQIIGTGNQRNGTVYADSTAQDFTLNNEGLIDAGAGNEGAGFSVELAATGSAFDVNNSGTIQGRGNAAAGLAAAGDGLRFERTRNAGVLDGSSVGVFNGDITNSGIIASEAANGTAAGIRFVNGTSFAGTIDNSGTISGVQNGLYFGNATPAGGGDFSAAIVNNSGIISSGSRALNIDGTGLTVNNSGQIIGTGNQRNGTVYADSSAQDFTLNNLTDGLIDAGAGNQGAGFSVELSAAGNSFDIVNDGTIQGRGTAAAGATTAGDGLRFERTRNAGLLDGSSSGLFAGSIANSGTIASEGDSGTTAGIRFVNGVSFNGTINNSGTISGVQNGLYFGNATPAGGGDFTGAIVSNSGTISSGSRALNIDGTGLVVNNSGSILGSGAQRNGTVYADGTANNFTLNNTGTVDAGVAGSGVSFQLGVNDGDTRSFTLVNDGTIAGRGDAQASGASAGLRLFNGAGAGTTVSVADDIVNNGTISSETGPALLIENIDFTGRFINNGTLSGPIAVDASTALSGLNFVQNGGALAGRFVGSAFADTLAINGPAFTLAGDITGGVDVTTDAATTVTVSGPRAIAGNLTSNGTLAFDLGFDSLAVDGDVTLGGNSAINVATTNSALSVGSAIEVITETGAFTNNGVTVNVADDDFLVDYDVALGSLRITPTATDLSNVSADANINSFGSAVASAVGNNRLPAAVFSALNSSADTGAFETTSLSLLPAINDGVTREIFETQRAASDLLNSRLSGDKTGIWGQISYRNADRDAASLSAIGYDADAISFTLGLDRQLSENAKVGVLLNYADINVDAYGPATEQNDINSYQISAYAGLDFGAAFVNAELGYSFNDAESQRRVLGAAITSISDVDGLIADISGGYTLDSGNFTITPTAGLRYASLSRDSFTENGGLGLALDIDRAEFLEASLGLNIAGKKDDSKDLSVVPFANIAYSYDLIGDGFGANASFNNGLDSFRLTAGESSDSRFDLGAGLNLINKNGFSVGAEYQGRFASDYQAHSGGVRVRFEF